MKNMRVLVGVPLVESASKILESTSVVDVRPFIEYDELLKIIPDYDGMISGPVRCDAVFFENAHKLRALSTAGVGYDNIDLQAATKHNVVVANVPGTMAESVAELSICLILAAARKLVTTDNLVKKGGWDFQQLRGIELWNKTAGQIGCGRIGALVVKKLKEAFSMRVLVYDPYITRDMVHELGGEQVELDTLLMESDVVSINASLTKETYHLIGEEELSLMKKNAIIVNAGRGEIVDENALLNALRKGDINSAALDVIESSFRDLDNPLFELENLILTPHIGANTDVSYEATLVGAARNIANALEGRLPKTVLNPEAEVVKSLRPID